jgi:hypothetical protein
MTVTRIDSAVRTLDSRLATLDHLLGVGVEHLRESEAVYFERRLAPDMLPLGTQVAFTCNQPRNFALWLEGSPADDLDPKVESLSLARGYISETRVLLSKHERSDEVLPAHKHLQLGPGLHADLTGEEYFAEFLLPNFYFHLVTSYAILRAAGVPLGKRDYMLHLLPKVVQSAI